MKAFKFALIALASLAMVACNNKPSNNNSTNIDDEDDDAFESLISVRDGDLSDWDVAPKEYIFEAQCPENALFPALKWVKFYADRLYINYCYEFDPSLFTPTDRTWLPVHFYINADGKATTGGCSYEFLNGAAAEILLEGAIYAVDAPIDYNPAVFQWWGANGEGIKDQFNTESWSWFDPAKGPQADQEGFGAVVPTGSLPIGQSQIINGNIVEGRLLRALIPVKDITGVDWANKIGIGMDIQKNYTSNGVLPQGPKTVDEKIGKEKLIEVTIDPNFYGE